MQNSISSLSKIVLRNSASVILFFFAGTSIQAEVLLKGYSSFAGVRYFALHDTETGSSAWVRTGDIFSQIMVGDFDAAKEALNVVEMRTKLERKLELKPSAIKSDILALSRQDALLAIRRLLEIPKNETGRSIKIEDLPKEVQEKIAKTQKQVLLEMPTQKMSPIGPSEKKLLLEKAEKSNLVLLEGNNSSPVYSLSLLKPLSIQDVPEYISRNITQKDLDALLADQIRSAELALKDRTEDMKKR
jgi:hypothetical protein